MMRFYLALAVRSLVRRPILTALMIATIGCGISGSMIILTVYRAMAGNPIPQSSAQLFVPQIDNWGPDKERPDTPDQLPDQLSYSDAQSLLSAPGSEPRTAMYVTGLVVNPENSQVTPFLVRARATTRNFFEMFAVPFRYGSAWSSADDTDRSPVVVLTRELNDRVFGGKNSVGQVIRLGDDVYRVVGVLEDWVPIPRIYDLINNRYGKMEDVLLPLSRAIERALPVLGNEDCRGDTSPGWQGHLNSDCVWIQFWVQLSTAQAVANYRAFLSNYAAEQQRNGRFHWLPATRLRDASQWLLYEHVVPDEVRVTAVVAFTFLFVCLVNSMGLMLAKILGRATDIGVHRALGASRRAIFFQFLAESAVVGLAGGLVGLLLTSLGLLEMRSLFTSDVLQLTRLDLGDVLITIILAISATTCAGVYPTWRATRIQVASQLKAI